MTEVIVFPLHRTTREVRAAAIELLSHLRYEDRDRSWKRIVKRHRRQLAALGLPPDDIELEIAAFHVAVGCEGRRRIVLGIDDGRGAA